MTGKTPKCSKKPDETQWQGPTFTIDPALKGGFDELRPKCGTKGQKKGLAARLEELRQDLALPESQQPQEAKP